MAQAVVFWVENLSGPGRCQAESAIWGLCLALCSPAHELQSVSVSVAPLTNEKVHFVPGLGHTQVLLHALPLLLPHQRPEPPRPLRTCRLPSAPPLSVHLLPSCWALPPCQALPTMALAQRCHSPAGSTAFSPLFILHPVLRNPSEVSWPSGGGGGYLS